MLEGSYQRIVYTTPCACVCKATRLQRSARGPTAHHLGCSLELGLHLVLQQLPHVLEVACERRPPLLAREAPRGTRRLLEFEAQLPRPLGEAAENRSELEAVLEERETAEDVQADASSAHRH